MRCDPYELIVSARQRKPRMETKVAKKVELETGARQVCMFASEKGGVWKTTTAAELVRILSARGKRVGVVQVDAQTRLEATTGVAVTAIKMPTADELRRNDLADAEALSPILDSVFDANLDAVVIDVGANYDWRFADFWASQDLDDDLKATGTLVTGVRARSSGCGCGDPRPPDGAPSTGRSAAWCAADIRRGRYRCALRKARQP